MPRVSISKLLYKNKALILAYDQGMEHGPTDFNEKNVDPEYIANLALEGRYSALAFGAGLAEKYYEGAYKSVPLICKLNMKSKLARIDPISRQVWSVEHAIKLGASAVGFTIYDGSPNEPQMFEQFGKIVEQAHDYGIPVVAWMYPRGPDIKELDNEVLAYSARIGLELGADIIKMKFNGDLENLKWCVRCAGRTKVVISGGDKIAPETFLTDVQKVMSAGCLGMAVGRNVWQSDKPFSITRALHAVVYDGKSALEANQYLK